jgi:hypothetical protein
MERWQIFPFSFPWEFVPVAHWEAFRGFQKTSTKHLLALVFLGYLALQKQQPPFEVAGRKEGGDSTHSSIYVLGHVPQMVCTSVPVIPW